jgi:hypothetical protein
MSKGKLDNMCFDAGIWESEGEKDRQDIRSLHLLSILLI